MPGDQATVQQHTVHKREHNQLSVQVQECTEGQQGMQWDYHIKDIPITWN